MTQSNNYIGNWQPAWLAKTLFIFLIIYLCIEAVFNARLVEIAGSGQSIHDELYFIELFGRTISGMGVTLIVADILLKGKKYKSTKLAVINFLLIAIITWPLVFFGQKYLLDNYIINTSTAEQRQNALFVTMLRSGLANNTIEISGLPYDPEHSSTASEMTFLTLLGVLVHGNNDFTDNARKQSSTIAERFITNQVSEHFEEYYGSYQNLKDKLHSGWSDYKEGVKRYDRSLDVAYEEAEKTWKQVDKELDQGWERLNKSRMKVKIDADRKSADVGKQIRNAWEHRNNCIDRYSGNTQKKCIDRVEKAYKNGLRKNRLPYQPMSFWLEEKLGKRNGKIILGDLFSEIGGKGLSDGWAALQKKANHRELELFISGDPSHYSRKLIEINMPSFESRSGYPYTIDRATFLHHKTTGKKISKKLAKQGLDIDNGWSKTGKTGFMSRFVTATKNKAKKSWNTEMRKHGMAGIPPYLSWQKFQHHKVIQNKIKQEMDHDLYTYPILATWNNAEFKDQVIGPKIRREVKKLLDELAAKEAFFADGGSLEKKGKDALRSIIVPPISMGLSLFLLLLTAAKLPLKLYGMSKYNQNGWIVPVKDKTSKVISVCILLALVFVPLIYGTSKYTNKNSTVNYLLDEFDKQGTSQTSHLVRWVLNTQPLIQPVGIALDDKLQISNTFQRFLRPAMAFLDEAVLTKYSAEVADTGSLDKNNGSKYLLPFTVHSTPYNSRIRVMNIKPKYNDGIMLSPGYYDVLVEAAGYQPQRINIHHSKGSKNHVITLNRI